jgi:hypothetical protein
MESRGEEFARVSEKFSRNFKRLKNTKAWHGRTFDEKCIEKIVADFYHFIMHEYIHRNDNYFCRDSELAKEDKFEKIRTWEKLCIKDDARICFRHKD